MEQKLINALIASYKERGIDLYALVDDPLFVSLPLEKKVEMIKKYAQQIVDGTTRNFSKEDLKAALKDAALSGTATGLASAAGVVGALSHYHKGKIPWGSTAIGLGIGAGVGAIGSLLEAKKIYSQRMGMVNSLQNLSKNPTDENAINTLITRNKQVVYNPNISATSRFESRLRGAISEIPARLVQTIIPAQIVNRTFIVNADTPLQSGVTKDQILSAINRASEEARNNQHFKF